MSELDHLSLPSPEFIDLDGSFEVTGEPGAVQALLSLLQAFYLQRVFRRFEVVLMRPQMSIIIEWPYEAAHFESYRVYVSASVLPGHVTLSPLIRALSPSAQALPPSRRA
ncbi:hypothetical protein [Deinococcus sp. QL22]|uniref:hypothetical protein n=1 Tax=Deinococcus sp. QL22 TaxID=2939437 RepID=UPI0020178D59|nr:hypothetical protein [Deinococcus sp. QL22]UQN10402.1 hypothetical protein M1R55_30070 [Deinococcus sp. QL22]UQN10536.1 hypothetical protein M1R55_29395 [Deinococcus sp. QL22]